VKHEELHWTTNDGLKLYAQGWAPDQEAVAILCLVHGLGEHSGRYSHWAAKYTDAGFAVLSFDLRGHGKSEGLRGHAPSFDHLADDISLMLNYADKHYEGKPVFLYGHSLGGLLALYYLTQRRPSLKGAIITSPGLRTIAEKQKMKLAFGRAAVKVIPHLTVPNGLDRNNLCHEPEVIKAYQSDPLVHDRISLALAAEMIEATDYILSSAGELKTPLLVMHGSDDELTYASGSEELAAAAQNSCTLKLYEGLFHELHNEFEQDTVFADQLEWLTTRLGE